MIADVSLKMKTYFIALLAVIFWAPSLFGAEPGWHGLTVPAYNNTNGLYAKPLTIMPKQWVSEGSTGFLALGELPWIGSGLQTNNMGLLLGSHPAKDLLGDIGVSISLTNSGIVSNKMCFTVECNVTQLTLPKGATYSETDVIKVVIECLQKTLQGVGMRHARSHERELVVKITGDQRKRFPSLSRTYTIKPLKWEKTNNKIQRTK